MKEQDSTIQAINSGDVLPNGETYVVSSATCAFEALGSVSAGAEMPYEVAHSTDAFIAKGPPKRWWGFLWRGAVALHELYHHAADILEHIERLFRRRRPHAEADTPSRVT